MGRVTLGHTLIHHFTFSIPSVAFVQNSITLFHWISPKSYHMFSNFLVWISESYHQPFSSDFIINYKICVPNV